MPYFSCTQKPSSIFTQGDYHWEEISEKDFSQGMDISGLVIERLSEKVTGEDSKKFFQELAESLGAKDLKLPEKGWYSKPRLKLSLDPLAKILVAPHDGGAYLVDFVLLYLRDLAINYEIVFESKDVFLVPEGQNPPPQYRADSDLIVTSQKDYLARVNSLDYQLSKAMLNVFLPREAKKPVADAKIKNLAQKNIAFSLGSGLGEKPYFSSVLEAFALLKSSQFRWGNLGDPKTEVLTLAFGPEVSISELAGFSKIIEGDSSKEVIFIFQNDKYADEGERSKAYAECLDLITKLNCKKLVHVFLQTKAKVDKNILELMPESQAANQTFSPLKEGAGFYLSSPEFFSQIYRNRQGPMAYQLRLASQMSQGKENGSCYLTSGKEELTCYVADDSGSNCFSFFWQDLPKDFPRDAETLCKLKPGDSHYSLLMEDIAKASHEKKLADLWFLEKKLEGLEKPKEKPSGTYIYAKEAGVDFRASKLLDKKAVKTQAVLSMQKNQALNQDLSQDLAQDLSQDLSQNLNQDVAKNLSSTLNHGQSGDYFALFRARYDLEGVCTELKTYAEKMLENYDRDSRLESLYLSFHYRKNHGEKTFLQNLVKDEDFRLKLAAKLFGYAHTGGQGKQALVYLPGYTLDYIEGSFLKTLFWDDFFPLPGCLDGFDPTRQRRTESKFLFGSASLKDLTYYPQFKPSSSSKLFSADNLPAFASALAGKTSSSQDKYPYSLLLSEKDLELLSAEERLKLIEKAESLLDLFSLQLADAEIGQDCLAKKKKALFGLIDFYFSQQEDPQILETFLTLAGGVSEDDLRILTQLLISSPKERMKEFLHLLKGLEKTKFLKEFHQIYFQYAPDVFSLVNFFKNNPSKSHFIQIAREDYAIKNTRFLPFFKRFAASCLVFLAKHNLEKEELKLINLQEFWNELSLKVLRHTAYQEAEAQALLERLVESLCTEDGLTLAPLSSSHTLFSGLNQVIDHAISHHCLEEQLAELKGLSLAYTDLPYALKFNDFRLVSAEMELKEQAIDPQKASYGVSGEELQETLKNHREGQGPYLKRQVFRYLGGQRFCEDLGFYKELYASIQGLEPAYLQESLLAYYVLSSTGKNYQIPLDPKKFSQGFVDFFQQLPLAPTYEATLIQDSVNGLFARLKTRKTDAEKGVCTLWNLWQGKREKSLAVLKNPEDSIPEILSRKFPLRDLKSFLLKNREALIASLPLLSADSELSFILMRAWYGEEDKKFSRTGLGLLRGMYPDLSLEVFLKNLVKIIEFQEAYSLLVERSARGKVYVALKSLIEKKALNLEQSLLLTELISAELAENKWNKKAEPLCADFLEALSKRRYFLKELEPQKLILALILKHHLSAEVKALNLSFRLAQRLQDLNLEKTLTLLPILLKTLGESNEAYLFFRKHRHLEAKQWVIVAELLEEFAESELLLSSIALILKQGEDLKLFQEALRGFNQEQKSQILTMAKLMALETKGSFLAQINLFKALKAEDLEDLYQLHELYQLKANDFSRLLEKMPLAQALLDFSREKQLEHLERYDYELKDIGEKIAAIRYRGEEGDLALDTKTQEDLQKDYQGLMAYMQTKPVLVEEDGLGNREAFTVNRLSKAQMQRLLQELNKKISGLKPGAARHEYELMRLALICEAFYRTKKQFPRSTQILTLLNQLTQSKNVIHEVQTGEGKSIIAAFQAISLYDGKTSIDLATENKELAAEGLRKFKRLYAYLGIPCGSEIISAESEHENYIEGGINYSTPFDLMLFRERMELEKKSIPLNKALVCDEIDAVLTTTVEARLSANLSGLEADSWSRIYQSVLAFVEEKELFLENKCSRDDDVANFRVYFELHHSDKDQRDFLRRIESKDLSKLIESARVSLALDENIDFMVLKKRHAAEIHSYAAPMVEKRPNSRINYADRVQQLLHVRLNQGKPHHAFKIDPYGETLLTVSVKNFFDSYRRHGGRIIGLTGTGGSKVELKEFADSHDLHVFSYPTFYPNLRKELDLVACFSREEQKKALIDKIAEERAKDPHQPILIITASPQESLELQKYVERQGLEKIQIYHGSDEGGVSEAKIIAQAGEDNSISIANESLARGADFQPKHEAGLFVINTNSAVTSSGLRQIFGRAGRNGKPGKACNIIDLSPFISADSSHEDQVQAFSKHQEGLSLNQQKQRLEMRLLEESRYLIVHDYLLALRKEAEALLNRQEGTQASLVSEENLSKTLADFNQRAEAHYRELLVQKGKVDGEVAEIFLAARVKEYQEILASWLPKDRFADYKPIEPLIQLENLKGKDALNRLQLKDLSLLSEILAKGWQHQGHQKMDATFKLLDKLLEDFAPYFNEEKKLPEVLAQVLLNQGVMTEKAILQGLDDARIQAGEFITLATKIPIIGRLLPKERLEKFVTDYIDTTKKQVKDKEWNEIRPPQFELESLTFWVSGMSKAITVASLLIGGPIPFIVNKIVIPTLMSWLSPLLQRWFKQSESSSLQMLAGISNLSSDLIALVENFNSFSTEQSLEDFLAKQGHFLENKALHALAIKYLQLNKQEHLIAYVEALPELLAVLEPYKKQRLKDLQAGEIALALGQKAIQNQVLKKAWAGSALKEFLPRFNHLSPELFPALSQLNLKDLLALAKVFAHPEFAQCLKLLPPEADFSQLVAWIHDEAKDIPVEVSETLEKLKIYQNNAERLAEDSRQRLLSLREEFKLSLEGLKSDLSALKPRQNPEILPAVEEKANLEPLAKEKIELEQKALGNFDETPWLFYASLSLGLGSWVVVNFIFLSLTLFLTSLVLMSMAISPFVWPLMESKAEPPRLELPLLVPAEKETNTEPVLQSSKVNESVEPILIYLPKAQETENMNSLVSTKNLAESLSDEKALDWVAGDWNTKGARDLFFIVPPENYKQRGEEQTMGVCPAA